MEWLVELLNNEHFVWGVMSVLIFAFTQVLKLPIKHFTKKIENERFKKIANISILVLAYGIAVLLDFLFAHFYLHTDLNLMRAFYSWSGSSAVYSFIERFFGKKVENEHETAEGQAVKLLFGSVAKDNKVDKNDKTAVDEFLEKVK